MCVRACWNINKVEERYHFVFGWRQHRRSYSRPLAVFFFRAEQVPRCRLGSLVDLYFYREKPPRQPAREIAICSQIGNSLRSVKPRGRSVTLPNRRYS